MNQPLKVSVIIPAFNAVRALPVVLKALAEQTYPKNQYEVIIVDDCSTDGTSEFLHTTAYPPNFHIVRHLENQDRAVTRNTGIRQSSGEILIFLDADMEVKSDFIAKHVAHFNNTDVVGIIGSLRPAPEIPLDKYQRYLYFGKRGVTKYPTGTPLPFQVFLFNNTSVRREVLEQVGFFDKNLRLYGGEDAELAFRIWQKFPDGLFYDPDIVVTHHHYRPLSQVLKLVENFGRRVVPYLVGKHPEIAALYGTKYVRPKSGGSNNFRCWLGRLWRTDLVIQLVWFLYEITPYPASNQLVRGLLASALLKGIAKSVVNKTI